MICQCHSMLFRFSFAAVCLLLMSTGGNSNSNKGAIRQNRRLTENAMPKYVTARKLAFEDNFQQKISVGADPQNGPSQRLTPFEDGFSSPQLSDTAPQTPHGYAGNGRPFAEFLLPINGNPPRVRPFDCNGKKDGIYLERDGACSNSFWGCSTGKPFPYGCPKGLFYNVINGKCDHRANIVACGGRPLNSSEEKRPSPEALASFNCSDKKDGLHALRHCESNVFFLCLEGRPAEMSACSSGLMFDEENSECAFIDQCANKKPGRSQAKINSIGPVLEHGTSAYYFGGQYVQRQLEIANFNCSGKQNGAYKKSFCAPSFFTCTNGILREFNCSTNSVYDAKRAQCTLPQICWQKSSQPVASHQPQPVQLQPVQPQPQPQPVQPQPVQPQLVQPQPVQPQPVQPQLVQPQPVQPQPVVNFNCGGKADGNYLQQSCQPTYLVCSNSALVKMNCPAKLVFDPTTAACEYPDNCNKNNAPAGGSNPSAGPVFHQPSPPSINSPLQAAAPFANFSCSGRANGHYGQGHCQPNFVNCFNSLANPQNCHGGLVYDETAGKCEHPQKCGQIWPLPPKYSQPMFPPASPPTAAPPRRPIITQNSTFRCKGRVDGYYFKRPCAPHFYTCVGGHATQLTCPGNLLFDPSRALCQYPRMCNDSAQSPPGKPTTPGALPPPVHPPQPPPPDSDFRCGAKRNGYYVRRHCTSHFYTCLAGTATKLACPGKLVFDMNSLSCQYAENCAEDALQQNEHQQSGKTSPSVSAHTQHNHQPQHVHPSATQQPQQVHPFATQQPQHVYPSAATQHNHQPQHVHPSAATQHNHQPQHVHPSAATQQNHQPQHVHPSAATQQNHQPQHVHPSAATQHNHQPQHVHPLPTGQIPSTPSTQRQLPPKLQQPPTSASRNSFTTSSQPPVTSTTINSRQYRNNASVPPEAKDGRRLPPRRVNQLHYNPTIDHSLSGGFCVTFRKNDGLYPASDGCGSDFYACTAGITTKMDCPLGLFYDAVLSQCNHRENVAKCGGQRSDSMKIVPLAFVTSSAHQNNVHTAVITTLNVSAPNFTCSGRAIGYYSHGCSSTYFSCTGLNAYTFTCPAHLKYTELAGQCNYENNVPECGGTVLAPPPPPVPAPPTNRRPNVHVQNSATNNPCGQLPNGTYGPKCSPYYLICLDGVPQDFLCQDDFVFHSPIGKWMAHEHNHHGHGQQLEHHHNSADGGGTQMSMHAMFFHFGVNETILFGFWRTNSALGIFLSCLAILALCFGLEFASSRQSSSVQLTNNGQADAETRRTRLMAVSADASLHAIQLTLSYLLMLIFMTFNVWLLPLVTHAADDRQSQHSFSSFHDEGEGLSEQCNCKQLTCLNKNR
uniref:Chitin-binding type-2 domain-containing protein n=1 Tax=Globodera rostochiensis TaxID=31243 RepID=A0A914HYU7_GLORO